MLTNEDLAQIQEQYESLDRDIIREWIAELRSGKYKQGKELLAKQACGYILYCCLGVLEEVVHTPKQKLGVSYSFGFGEERETTHTSKETARKINLPEICNRNIWVNISSEAAIVEMAKQDWINTEIHFQGVSYAELKEEVNKHTVFYLTATALNDASIPFSTIANLLEKTYLVEDFSTTEKRDELG